MQRETVILRILRCKPGIVDPPRFQDYALDVTEHTTVLDGLDRVRLDLDPTLMYGRSCHHAACGTCACVIDGTERLACATNVLALGRSVVTVEPLHGFERVGDLAVERAGYYAHIGEMWNCLQPVESPSPSGEENLTRFENCIECGCCVSACPACGKHDAFMGPAALAAIARELAIGSTRPETLLDLAGGEKGERWCNRSLACSRVCPTAVYPARHIADLRKRLGKDHRGRPPDEQTTVGSDQ